ncbi:hypothetical protein HDV05_001628 [Chytridiales sp. JEL 0842]|nr:hypothetical protein HDV05_001628 [Chytridiales sp. JEL 0842]
MRTAPKPSTLSVVPMGDRRVYTNSSTYISTTKSEYTLPSSYSSPSTSVPAGKPGAKCSTRDVNIVLGDTNLRYQPDRYKSVNAETYLPLHPEPQDQIIAHSKWDTKGEKMMSQAHVGLKTRMDIPHDNTKFKCFTTTSQDTFKPPPPRARQEKVNGVSGGRLGISWGDDLHIKIYETTSKSTFKPHLSHPLTLPVPKQTTSHLKFDNSAPPTALQSTTQETFKQIPSTRLRQEILESKRGMREMIERERGQSSIAFGERPKNGASVESVTMRDFKEVPVVARPDIKAQKALNGGSGVLKAIYPHSTSETQQPETRQPPKKEEGKKREDNVVETIRTLKASKTASSIPFGDPSYFSSSSTRTTHNVDFPSDNPERNEPRPQFPTKGARMTRSNVEIGYETLSPFEESVRYLSTSKRAFGDPTGSEKRVVPVVPQSSLQIAVGGEYPMRQNLTTTSEAFKEPNLRGEGRVWGRAPLPADRILIFPSHSIPATQAYQTTTRQGFRNREELWETPQKTICSNNTNRVSSVTFGDPRHFRVGVEVV